MNPELINAIRERLTLGRSPEEIRNELAQVGYDAGAIDLAMAAATGGQSAPTATVAGVVLPGATELIHEGWSFTKRYFDLVLLLAVPFLLVELVSHFMPASPLVGIGTLLALLVYVVLIMAALRIVTLDTGTEKIVLGSALPWVRANFTGLMWISILTMLVVWGGFLLFIIPAIVVSLSIYLAQFVYVKEGVRGMAALLRSRELIQGYWWAVFGRVMMILFIFMLALFAFGFFAAIVALLVGGTDFIGGGVGMLVFDLGSQVLGSIMTLVGLKVALIIYERLQLTKPAVTAASAEGKGGYLALAWLGVLFPLVIAAVTGFILSQTNVGVLLEQELMLEEAKQRAIELRTEQAEMNDGWSLEGEVVQ